MTTIYVAGASAEVDTIVHYVDALRVAGYTITEDWTESVLAQRAQGKTQDQLSERERIDYAVRDLVGVVMADYVWIVIPARSSISVGAWVELGAALARNRHVLVSGDDRRSIFTACAFRTFATHDEALAWLVAT